MTVCSSQIQRIRSVYARVLSYGVLIAVVICLNQTTVGAQAPSKGQPSQRRTAPGGAATKPAADGTVDDLSSSILGARLRADGDKIIISHIRRGGPADRAGVRPGDQLTSIEKHKIDSLQDALKVLQHFQPGQGVVMTVLPKAGPRQLYMGPGLTPSSPLRQGNAMLGATLTDTTSGVTVGQLSVGGPAVVGGIRTGDTLLSIDGQPFKTKQQLMDYISQCHVGHRVDLQIRRGEWQRTLIVTLGAKSQVAGLPKMNVPPIQGGGGTATNNGANQVTTSVDNGDEWADETEAQDIYNVNDRALYTDFD